MEKKDWLSRSRETLNLDFDVERRSRAWLPRNIAVSTSANLLECLWMQRLTHRCYDRSGQVSPGVVRERKTEEGGVGVYDQPRENAKGPSSRRPPSAPSSVKAKRPGNLGATSAP